MCILNKIYAEVNTMGFIAGFVIGFLAACAAGLFLVIFAAVRIDRQRKGGDKNRKM